jgi:cyclophilin family peptidyl-prolyl cis-trans isomerase
MNHNWRRAGIVFSLVVLLAVVGCSSLVPAPPTVTPAPTETPVPPTATPAPPAGGVGQIEGTLTDYDTNEKVSDVFVFALAVIRDTSGQPQLRPDVDVTNLPQAKSDANGHFTLDRLPAGEYAFAANKTGDPATPNFSPVGDNNRQVLLLMVEDGQTTHMDGYILRSRLEEPTPPPAATPPVAMEIDPTRQYTATIKTDVGDIKLELFADKTPITVNNFVHLARTGFYDGGTFHRVIEGFMAQGGDPTGTGTGGPGYEFMDEIVPDLKFDQPGLLAMANAGPNTNGSQFFITFEPTPWLDGQHTIFGKVVEGMDVLPKIVRRDPQDPQAPEPTKIISISIEEK